MTAWRSEKLTANFERNLQTLAAFFIDAQAHQAFDALLNERAGIVIPSLERFPDLDRLLMERPSRSVETAKAMGRLTQQLSALAKGGELREYAMAQHPLLYARISGTVYLLSIRHQRQLSFDFQALWRAAPWVRDAPDLALQ